MAKNHEGMTKIECGRKVFWLTPEEMAELDRINKRMDANPFYYLGTINTGEPYYIVHECEGMDKDYTHIYSVPDDTYGFIFDEGTSVKTQKFAVIQFWREHLCRLLAMFKYENDDRCGIGSECWLPVVDEDIEGECSIFPKRFDYTPIGSYAFSSEMLAQKAIEEVIKLSMEATGLEGKDRYEILRVI